VCYDTQCNSGRGSDRGMASRASGLQPTAALLQRCGLLLCGNLVQKAVEQLRTLRVAAWQPRSYALHDDLQVLLTEPYYGSCFMVLNMCHMLGPDFAALTPWCRVMLMHVCCVCVCSAVCGRCRHHSGVLEGQHHCWQADAAVPGVPGLCKCPQLQLLEEQPRCKSQPACCRGLPCQGPWALTKRPGC